MVVATTASGEVVGVKPFAKPYSERILWRSELGGKANGGFNVLESMGVLVAGTFANTLVVLEAATGTTLAAIETDAPVNGAVAVSVPHRLAAAGDCSGTLTVVNLSSLVTRHSNDEPRETNDDVTKIDLGSYLPSHPVFAGEALYAVTHEGTLYAFDVRDLSAPLHTVELEESFMTAPAVSESWIVLGSSEGTVWVLERESMAIEESLKTTHGPWLAPLICGDTAVLMASKDGVLAAYSLPDLTELWRMDTLHEFIGGAMFYGTGIAIAAADGTLSTYSFP